ncbi:hypothetical protein KSW79_01990 [Prevotella copri]|mgnify:FL=1|uniref:hypothetical protein n=1 Tax=Segatella copri TaxID=165179 RepID=UPI001C39266F|nr:hypothetical protein [Segatella copri]MBV3413177.1 hypothetical protein [Segatella copri]
MKKIYTVAKYAKSIMLAAVMTASALTTVNAQEADNTTYAPAEANSWWRGEEVTGEEQQVYVYNVGAGIFATTDNTPSEKNIDNAALWTLSNNQFSCGDYHINMWSDSNAGLIWYKAINTAKATVFNFVTGDTQDRGFSYKLSKTDGWLISYTRYFNVDNNEYTAAKTKSEFNDFLFISPEQKEAYSTYSALYKEASELTTNEKISTSLLNQLKEILTSTATANYGTYTTNKTTLQNIINTIKTYLNSTPTGIDNINANSSAKAEAIFSVNGVRNAQFNKGLNIVKMSDGSIKKIMVK